MYWKVVKESCDLVINDKSSNMCFTLSERDAYTNNVSIALHPPACPHVRPTIFGSFFSSISLFTQDIQFPLNRIQPISKILTQTTSIGEKYTFNRKKFVLTFSFDDKSRNMSNFYSNYISLKKLFCVCVCAHMTSGTRSNIKI